jgi:hypothetical protein
MTMATARCRCGAVEAQVSNAAAGTVNRIVCYCDDCQAFAHHLGRADLLDGHAGTDIVQVAPAAVKFTRGQERIAGVRLSPKGLYRWHTTCCNTPIGNTVAPRIPFVGFVAQTFDHDAQRADAVFGNPTGGFLGRYAIGDVPKKWHGMNLRIVVRAMLRVLGWKLTGKTWPHPFFDRATGAPVYPLRVIALDERQALRAKCGPQPA